MNAKLILQMVHMLLEAIKDGNISLALNNIRTMPIYAKVTPIEYKKMLDKIQNLIDTMGDE